MLTAMRLLTLIRGSGPMSHVTLSSSGPDRLTPPPICRGDAPSRRDFRVPPPVEATIPDPRLARMPSQRFVSMAGEPYARLDLPGLTRVRDGMHGTCTPLPLPASCTTTQHACPPMLLSFFLLFQAVIGAILT